MGDPTPALTVRLAIRKRPGMYIGDVGSYGLQEILDQVVTELLAALGCEPALVRCKLGVDGTFAIELRGGALPPIRPQDFDAEVAPNWPFTPLYSLVVVNALSERLDAEVVHDGRRWSAAFSAGLPVGPETTAPTTA